MCLVTNCRVFIFADSTDIRQHSMSITQIKWYNHVKDGCTSVESGACSGSPQLGEMTRSRDVRDEFIMEAKFKI